MRCLSVDKRAYVVLLNWRGWQDTIACLETMFASEGVPMCAVVCDNASGDGSLDHIAAWAEGTLASVIPSEPRLAGLFGKQTKRPQTVRIDRKQSLSTSVSASTDLVLVDNGANLGFAAGNNVGLRLALAQPDMDCVWLLNNDTLVEPDCLLRMRNRLAREQDRAVCGSVIHFFDQPDIIQAVGGNRFNAYTGVAACSEGRFLPEGELPSTDFTVKKLDYLSGCSMLIPRAALEQVGLLGEHYFLYYEEIDWFTRNANRFPMVIAEGARLYHREGSSIGSSGWQRSASAFADGHMYRSRLIFMRKHYPLRLPFCYLVAALQLVRKLFHGEYANVRTVLAVIVGAAKLKAPVS
ncbi:rhamnosyl transferase [Halioglobus sp. HI00S01]|nr:rhamnosyl transferase [Halioglobus sp. HI00S01]